jgi:alanine racemase
MLGDRSGYADVSADGYGAGGMTVARVALDAGFAGVHVDGLDEALRLRASGYSGPLTTDTVPSWRAAEATHRDVAVLSPGTPVVRDRLYGFDSRAECVVRLSAKVLAVKSINRGDGVSYGYTFRASEPGRIALVAIGYGDGIHRRAGNKAEVLLGGRMRPVIGRVAMNVFVTWLGDDSVAIGDEAVLFGDHRDGEPTLESWALRVGDHPAVVTSTLGPRVIREHR